MREDQTDDLDAALGGLIRAVERADIRPSPALVARVLDDAARVQRAPARPGLRVVPPRDAPARPGWRRRAAPRAWMAQAGVAMAACLMVGFVIGYAMDEPMMDLDPLTAPGQLAAVESGDMLFALDEAI